MVVTAGVAALGSERVHAILRRVAEFETFTPENDRCGEHDFGSFEDGGERLSSKSITTMRNWCRARKIPPTPIGRAA